MNNNKSKILIIDDEYAIRESIEAILQKEGYDLFFAENGKEGITALNEVHPDIVLLDLHMPVMGGAEFLKEARIKPDNYFSVVVLTGYSDHESLKQCYDLGVNYFLRKPFDIIELRCVIKRSIELQEAEKQIIKTTQEREALKVANEKKKMELQMIHADKLISLGTMTAGVVHEISNPLSIVAGDIHLLKRDFADLTGFVDHLSKIEFPSNTLSEIEKLKEDADVPYITKSFNKKMSRCKEAMERIREIILNVKEFSHLDEEKIVATDINENIEKTLQIIPKKYKDGIEIKTEFETLPEISCFGKQVNQVFMNIIVNALQAMNGDGTLKIKTSLDDHFACIKFIDTGHGIPEEKLNNIFDPFFTTKPIGKGTGLGLSICKSIIEKNHGDLSVANNPDKGVTFTIKLLKSGVKSI